MEHSNQDIDLSEITEQELREHYEKRIEDYVNYLKDARIDKGISQQVLADATYIDRPRISDYENHKYKNVRFMNVLKICDVLGLEVIIREKR